VSGQRLNLAHETSGGKRLEPLRDYSAGSELDLQILAFSQRYDPQTGLLNHHAFRDALAALLKGSHAGQEVALIWIDLVNMQKVFSLWGWTGAEALARRIAGTLRSVADDDALLGRFGARSFLLAMGISKLGKSGRRRVQAAMDLFKPHGQRDGATELEVAAGVAIYPSDTESLDDLVRFASLAAGRAHYIKSRRVVAFHPRMNSMIVRDHLLETEMRKGLDQGQFHMVYQPKMNLMTGQILGAEALMRWNHPELGAISPAEFIPVAERSDLIHRIFDFALRTTLEQARRWRDLDLALPIVAVNASAANLRSDDFPRKVRTIMEKIPISPTQLELELTESLAFEDEELFAHRMRQLRVIGVRVAIDDFGTRYTGFNVLKNLPLNTMKIDQCFIRGIDRSPDMLALCETIVAMGRQLKLRMVAEGIEELGELAKMRQIGCEAGQGYLFQRPVPAEEFTAFMREWPERMREFGFEDAPDLFENDPIFAVV
jgi:EAL domain-containing protein (putative c-di-GMP-specific phosphodiesterase class I)/GGDEF domain-containing protein